MQAVRTTATTAPTVNPTAFAVKLALDAHTYTQDICTLKVAAATRTLTKQETRRLKALTALVERDRAFLKGWGSQVGRVVA